MLRLLSNLVDSHSKTTSEPCLDVQEREDVRPEHLTVQGLSTNQRIRVRNFAKPSTLRVPNAYNPHSNRSTITINNGRELRIVPAYLRQFEMSRQGSTLTISRPCPQTIVPEEAEEDVPTLKKTNNVFMRVVVAVLSRHRRFGFRHILLVLSLILYHIIGMLIFRSIEVPFERVDVMETRMAMNEAFEKMGNAIKSAAGRSNVDKAQQLKKAYLDLLKIDDSYKGSTFYKLEEYDKPLWTWTYDTAFFYAFQLYTTVGYGSISPSTVTGRAVTIVYAAIGFPITLVVLRDLSSVVLAYLTRLYAKIVRKIRKAGFSSSTDEIILPVKAALVISILYTLGTAVFVMIYDDLMGPEPGLDLFNSYYFSFITYATVGLGDVMPTNAPHAAVVAVVALLSFPLIFALNQIMYIGFESRIYHVVVCIENCIDRMVLEKNGEVEENVENNSDTHANRPDQSNVDN